MNKNSNKTVISIVVVFSIMMLLITYGLYSVNNEKDMMQEEKISEETEQDETTDNQIQNNENTRKKYILTDDEYKEYLNNLLQEIVLDKNNIFTEVHLNSRDCVYNWIGFNTNKFVEESVFDENFKIVVKKMYDELSKNDYETGGLFSCDYELFNISFYNFTDRTLKKTVEGDFIQINILDINKYDDFETFFKENTKSFWD